MAVAGVIAEYNPFHRGHAWQVAEIRRRLGTGTAVVACMSGNFVQRGSFAILNKHTRAESALLGGVDLVLELPTPWSAAGAERFAQGGVAALSAAGVVTHLAFGCECGALDPLQSVADCLESEAFRELLHRFTGEGMTFAAARQAAVQALAGDAAVCLASPNNTLAVEYLRALKASPLLPVALPRTGAAHDSSEDCGCPSASAIRQRMLLQLDWHTGLPDSTAALVSQETAAGRAPVSIERCQRAVLSQLRRMAEEEFFLYDGGGEGLYHRFYRAVHTASSLEDLLSAVKTKRYPLARLRRMLLQSYLGVPQAAQGETPPYLRVLGTTARGRMLLRQMKKAASLPVLVKPAHVRRLDREAQRIFDQEARCTDLYTLAYPDLSQAKPGTEYTAGPVML